MAVRFPPPARTLDGTKYIYRLGRKKIFFESDGERLEDAYIRRVNANDGTTEGSLSFVHFPEDPTPKDIADLISAGYLELEYFYTLERIEVAQLPDELRNAIIPDGDYHISMYTADPYSADARHQGLLLIRMSEPLWEISRRDSIELIAARKQFGQEE